jgi:hypothetical protein
MVKVCSQHIFGKNQLQAWDSDWGTYYVPTICGSYTSLYHNYTHSNFHTIFRFYSYVCKIKKKTEKNWLQKIIIIIQVRKNNNAESDTDFSVSDLKNLLITGFTLCGSRKTNWSIWILIFVNPSTNLSTNTHTHTHTHTLSLALSLLLPPLSLSHTPHPTPPPPLLPTVKKGMAVELYFLLCNSLKKETTLKGTSSIFIPIVHTWSIEHPWNASFHFSFLILYTVSRTPRTADQPVTRPLPTQDKTNTE